jgi:predicted RNA-binding protein YlqC (UPF0109 family)
MISVAIQMALCLVLAMPNPLWAVVQEHSLGHRFTIKGRVIGKDGKPVPNANVILLPSKTEREKEVEPLNQALDQLVNFYPTDSEGRFSIEEENTNYKRWILYVNGPQAKDTEQPISPPFTEALKRLAPSFAGQEIDVAGKPEIDLGDVPVQLYYGQITVHFSSDKNTKLNRNPSLRIRDIRGDRISESGISPKSFRNDNAAVAISLPEGKWYVGMLNDPSKGWHETSVSVSGSSEPPLEVHLDINSEVTKQSLLPSKDSESAKKELTRMGFQFTEEDFRERAESCNTEAVQLFLQAGMSPNAQDKYGTTILMEAVRWNCEDIIDLLLKEKADVNVRSHNGDTALITAVITYNEDLAKVLIKRGAKVNEQRTDGRTALMYAAFIGKIDIVKQLLRADANINLRDKEGKTALKLAMERGDREMIEYLKKAGAKE